MTLYTVHAPTKPDGVAVDPAELVFVKDGFSWPALLIPPVWLIYRRLWLTLLIWLVAVIVLGTLAGFAGTDASTVVMILFAFWFALEANGFRRWTLERRRHALVGVVEGRTLEEAERRYFAEMASANIAPVPASSTPLPPVAPGVPAPVSALSALSPTPPPPRPEPGIVGLFPSPGTGR